jgi:hypothetical protein
LQEEVLSQKWCERAINGGETDDISISFLNNLEITMSHFLHMNHLVIQQWFHQATMNQCSSNKTRIGNIMEHEDIPVMGDDDKEILHIVHDH